MSNDTPPRNIRRGHPASEDTVPPPRPLPGIPTTHRLTSETMRDLWFTAKRWSPAGIAAALLLVFFALGGREGVLELTRGLTDAFGRADALRGEISLLRAELERMNRNAEEERAARVQKADELSARIGASEHNLSLVCDLASELNLGRPNPTWCSVDGRGLKWEAPPASGDRIPIHRTAAQWRSRDPQNLER